MSEINQYVGKQIRIARKAKGLTLQQLSDIICKSRATVSKYESGEIALDINTLYDIANALDVSISRLTDFHPEREATIKHTLNASNRSPFFEARRLYFYFYDGRYNRLKDGVINIYENEATGEFDATFSISTISDSGRSSETQYSGRVVYSDMLIRFSFVNQYNSLEEDLLYIFNPLELRDYSEGLLCGISSADLMPCAFKCLVTLEYVEPNADLKKQLLLTPKELKRWQKLNMLIVDNHS